MEPASPNAPTMRSMKEEVEWAFADGTNLKGAVTRMDGVTVYDADQRNAPIATDISIILYRISAQSARDLMKSRNVLRYAR